MGIPLCFRRVRMFKLLLVAALVACVYGQCTITRTVTLRQGDCATGAVTPSPPLGDYSTTVPVSVAIVLQRNTNYCLNYDYSVAGTCTGSSGVGATSVVGDMLLSPTAAACPSCTVPTRNVVGCNPRCENLVGPTSFSVDYTFNFGDDCNNSRLMAISPLEAGQFGDTFTPSSAAQNQMLFSFPQSTCSTEKAPLKSL